MGWTYTQSQGKRPHDLLRRVIDIETDRTRQRVLRFANDGSTIYAAVERTEKETNERTVFAIVFLTDRGRGCEWDFGYKGVHEDMGPVESGCPARILDLLTPTTNRHALEWREKCGKNAKATGMIRKGARLFLRHPIRFNDGAEFHEFHIASLSPFRANPVSGQGREYQHYRVGRAAFRRFVAMGVEDVTDKPGPGRPG